MGGIEGPSWKVAPDARTRVAPLYVYITPSLKKAMEWLAENHKAYRVPTKLSTMAYNWIIDGVIKTLKQKDKCLNEEIIIERLKERHEDPK